MDKPSYLGHRERIRKKINAEGLTPFLEHEILELLLTFSVPRKDTKKLAWALLKTFGSMSNIWEAENSDILKVKGIGPQSALLLGIISEILARDDDNNFTERQRILNQEELYNYVTNNLQDSGQEYLKVLFLDIKLKLIAAEMLVKGPIDKFSVTDFIDFVLKHGAKSIICVHNLGFAEPTPSKQDIDTVEKCRAILKALSVNLIDHVIVGAGKLYSLRKKGYLQKPKILL